jgi:superfamily II DNA/RNA helicase
VRRLLSQTPAGGQRLLFSATLDNGVDILVQKFMRRPVTHHVDSAAQAPIEMDHHVLHVREDDRFGILVDLLSAPGRSVVFTRTKRRAKVLTRQLNAAGVPAVELHGNLAQNARNRNLSAFSEGTSGTLVATDIAARGIHVDDVALVIHADPPVEHKAYLHRSGRTARAGARGTVITLMTDEQQADVRDLTRKAGIRPVTTRTRPGDALLAQLAPGERTFVAPAPPAPPSRPATSSRAASSRPASSSRAASPASADAPTEGGGRSRSRRPRRGRSGAAGAPAATETSAGSQSNGDGRGRRAASPERTAAHGGNAGQARASGQQRGSGQARGSAPRSGTPQQRPTSAGASGGSGGAAAFSARAGGRRTR